MYYLASLYKTSMSVNVGAVFVLESPILNIDSVLLRED